MKKRIVTVLLAGLLVLQITACGSQGDPAGSGAGPEASAPAAEESETAGTQEESTESAPAEENKAEVANPWQDITEDQAYGMIANLFSAPEGAENIRWSAMGLKDPDDLSLPGPLVQLNFDLDGLSFTERAQSTGDTASDISGMFFEWTVSEDVTLENWGGGNMTGKMYRFIGEGEMADLITWYDVETGVSYSLSTSSDDLDGFDIQAVAEATYDPSKQVGAGAPDEDHVPMDITGCDTFTQIADRLKPGEGYANASIAGQDVFLVTEGTYDLDAGDGKRFGTISADVFTYDSDGKIVYLGYVQAGGTAYPIAVGKDGFLYLGNNHGMKRMTIEDGKIVTDEEVYELFDAAGNAEYHRYSETGKAGETGDETLKDDSVFNTVFSAYQDADPVLFDTVK